MGFTIQRLPDGHAPMRGLAQLVLDGTAVADGIADASDALVLVPASRAKRAFERHLVDQAAMAGHALVAPTAITPGALATCLVVPSGRVLAGLGLRLSWRHALRESPESVVAALASCSEGEADRADIDLLSARIASLHREAASACLTFAEIARARGASSSAHGEGRWDALCAVERTWIECMARAGSTDLAVEARAACAGDRLRVAGIRRAFVLLADPEPLHRELLRALDRAGVVVTVAVHSEGSGLPAPLDPEGFPEHASWATAPIEVSEACILRAAGPASQAAAIIEAIAAVDPPRSSADFAVSIPQREVEAETASLLPMCGLRVQAAPSRRASDAPVGALLAALAAHLARPTCESLLALVRHPDLEGTLVDQGIQRPVASVAEFSAASGAADLPTLEEMRAWEDARAVLLAVDEWLRPLRVASSAGPAAIVPALRRALEAVMHDSSPEGHDAAAAFRRAVDEFRGLPAPFLDAIDAAGTARIVHELMAGTKLPSSGDPEGIELMGWLDAGIDDAPHMVLACMNDGVVPEGIQACPWVPDSLRQRIGMPCARRRQARDAWILHSLLARKRSVRMVVGRTNGAGEPLPPSRLLLRASGAALATRMSWLADDSAPLADPARWCAPTQATGSFRVDPRPLASAGFTSIRVTAFRDYLESPTLFRLRHDPRLRLAAAGAADGEMDPRAFGNVIHSVLQDWGREEADAARPTTDEREIRNRVHAALDSYRAIHFPKSLQPTYEVQLALMRERLSAFARVQASRAAEGWRVRHAELAFEDSPVQGRAHVVPAPTIGSAGIVLKGRIDRVDQHEDGTFAALDYKTSASASLPERAHRRRSGEWKDLQLPLYRYLLASLVEPIVVGPDGLGYFSLPSNPSRTTVRMAASWTDADLDDAVDTAHEIADAVARGSFPHDPTWAPGPDDDLAPVFGVGVRLDSDAGDAEGDAEEGVE